MGRVTINGTVAQFSCKRSISKELWDAKGNRAKGKSVEAKETNLALDNIKTTQIYAKITTQKLDTPFVSGRSSKLSFGCLKLI